MDFVISRHARKRMLEREIPEKEVMKALLQPDKIGHKNDTTIFKKLRNNGHLLLVISKNNKIITVITTSKVSKYY